MALTDLSSDLQILGGSPSEATGAASPYAVKLPVFEGPLDLLLHLIRQNEVEITDIPIARIGEQYLEYLELMQELSLDVAGEYLVMAATLALIKSRMLLPSEGESEDEDGLDPREDLVARLLEYQRFKEVAEGLAKLRLLGRDVFPAQGAGPERPDPSRRELEVGLFELLAAFRQVLEDARDRDVVHEVESEEITVLDRMRVVMENLERSDSMEFSQIFADPAGGRPSRMLVVATFLAILELARVSALRIYQGVNALGAPEGPIRLRAAPADGGGRWTDRISEHM